MAGTNGFYPAGFYGVAFDHLSDDIVIGIVEAADVFAASTGIYASADLALTENADVLVGDVLTANMMTLALIEDTVDIFVADTSSVTLLQADLVELADVLVMGLATTAYVDLAVTETTFDTVNFDVFSFTGVSVQIIENADVFAAKAGRWEFFYADSEAIRVAWEQQAVVVPGRPKSGESTYHPFITAFNEQAFYPNAFFTGSGAFHYDDDEAIRVPAPAVTERLREDRKSYVAPRRRI